jgi:hypothetical protein
VEGNNPLPLGKLFLWIVIDFAIGMGFGIIISMAKKPKSLPKGFLAGHFLYVFQFFSVEFNCTYFFIQRYSGVVQRCTGFGRFEGFRFSIA